MEKNSRNKFTYKTDEELKELIIKYWGYGMNDTEVCAILDISRDRFRSIITSDSELAEIRDIVKHKPQAKARLNIVTQIDEGDLETSKWYMERKNKAEFSNKIGLDISAELSPISAEEKLKAMNEFMSQFVDTEKDTENEK